MVGRVQKHKPIRDEVQERPETVFKVHLVTAVGFKMARKVVVDEGRGLLLIFTIGDILLRTIPITQLIQVRRIPRSASPPARLTQLLPRRLAPRCRSRRRP